MSGFKCLWDQMIGLKCRVQCIGFCLINCSLAQRPEIAERERSSPTNLVALKPRRRRVLPFCGTSNLYKAEFWNLKLNE